MLFYINESCATPQTAHNTHIPMENPLFKKQMDISSARLLRTFLYKLLVEIYSLSIANTAIWLATVITIYQVIDNLCGMKTSNSIWRPFPAIQKMFWKRILNGFNLFITNTLGPGVNNLWYVPFSVGGYTNIDTLVPEHNKIFVLKAYTSSNHRLVKCVR